jgi:hypothetical protein
MNTGAPVLKVTISKGQAAEIARAWRRESITELLSGASMLTLPLTACGTILGVFACTREEIPAVR